MLLPFKKIVRQTVDKAAPFPFTRPIFILAPPRSGSTFLFGCLTQFEELFHLKNEADNIWWDLFPYDRQSNFSDEVRRDDLTKEKAHELKRRIYSRAVNTYVHKHNRSRDWKYHLGLWPIRYLDKTIANCFHLEILDAVFPDAQYIILVRDPRENISSMMEGWPHLHRFGKPQLTPIIAEMEGATVNHWTYPAPPGWQQQLTRPLQEICAWSWRQHIECILSYAERNASKVYWVRYEDLRDRTRETVVRLARHLELKVTPRVIDYVKAPPVSNTSVSNPRPGKWKALNYDSIMSIIPMITGVSSRIGYAL